MIIAKNDLNDLGQSFHSRETARETFITQRCRNVTLRLFSLSVYLISRQITDL